MKIQIERHDPKNSESGQGHLGGCQSCLIRDDNVPMNHIYLVYPGKPNMRSEFRVCDNCRDDFVDQLDIAAERLSYKEEIKE